MPANAKLHGAELGYILEQSGARLCFVSDGIDTVIAPMHRTVSNGWSPSVAPTMKRCSPPIRLSSFRARRRSRLAVLYVGHNRPAERRDAHAINLMAASLAYVSEVDPVAPGDAILHAAPMSHGSGLYIMPHVVRLGVKWCRNRRLRARGDLALVHRWPRLDVRRTDHGQAAGRMSGRSARARISAPSSGAARRCMWRTR